MRWRKKVRRRQPAADRHAKFGVARSKPVDEFAAANPKYAVAAEHADDGDGPDGQNKSDAAGSSLRLGKGPTQSAPLGESECFGKREGSKHRVATDCESERNNAATAACAIAVIRIIAKQKPNSPDNVRGCLVSIFGSQRVVGPRSNENGSCFCNSKVI